MFELTITHSGAASADRGVLQRLRLPTLTRALRDGQDIRDAYQRAGQAVRVWIQPVGAPVDPEPNDYQEAPATKAERVTRQVRAALAELKERGEAITASAVARQAKVATVTAQKYMKILAEENA